MPNATQGLILSHDSRKQEESAMWIETSRSDNNITKSNNQTQDALAAEMGTTIEEDEDELVDKQTLSNVNLAGMAS